MSKGSPRHNPNKPQNDHLMYGEHCSYDDGGRWCEWGGQDTNVCKGNPHNCVKLLYRNEARKNK